MNAVDILTYGHRTVLSTLEGVPWEEWETPGVCGYWSVKEIIAHLASYECILQEVFQNFLTGAPTPTLIKLGALGAGFNDDEVGLRHRKTPQETLAEYTQAWEGNMALVRQIPETALRQAGTLPWYGLEYALDDYIVYQFYGHKREHSAQVAVFKDKLRDQAQS